MKSNKQHHAPVILVEIDCFHPLLRAIVLLNTMPDYHVDVINPGDRDIKGFLDSHITIHGIEEKGFLMEQANLVIGSQSLALEAVSRRKPVIVLGNCGLGGVITTNTVVEQYRSDFSGKIGGNAEDYFPLDTFQKEIMKGFKMSSEELEIIARKVEEERLADHSEKIVSSSY